jgi:signal transduction histidine kinase
MTTNDTSMVLDPAEVPVNILIVDDEPKNLLVLESVLDDPGYRMVRATSGDEALLALMADEFALLILDVRMPGMSGFELAHLVKERRKTARIPIIFLTAYYNEDQHILEGYVSGAVDYLHKPVNPPVLRSKVAVFAELHRRGRALENANKMLLGEVSERRNAEAKLGELNANLDRRVRERTRELQASEAQLVESARRKDEFMATLAHELRNPLAPVRNAVEVLKRASIDATRLDWATRIIDRQVGSLSRLIDDLMDLSRINQGRIELKRSTVTLGEVLAEAIEMMRPQVDAAGHDLAVMLPNMTLAVDGDATRLTQAFANLLHNAVKYTDPGGRIDVGVVVEKGAATVTIRDNGIGIPPDKLDAVFEMFTQVEAAQSRARGGLGIGLALTQRLISLHGGHIKAFSEGLGKGSRFSVTLPLVQQVDRPEDDDASGQGDGKAQGPSGLDIVVADDNADAAETLAELLGSMGHRVVSVGNGKAAVAEVLKRRPQLAILDIGMPQLDGHGACRQIVAGMGEAKPMLVALTGWGQTQDIARSEQAGFDRHLVKPVDAAELDAILAECAERRPPTKSTTSISSKRKR